MMAVDGMCSSWILLVQFVSTSVESQELGAKGRYRSWGKTISVQPLSLCPLIRLRLRKDSKDESYDEGQLSCYGSQLAWLKTTSCQDLLDLIRLAVLEVYGCVAICCFNSGCYAGCYAFTLHRQLPGCMCTLPCIAKAGQGRH